MTAENQHRVPRRAQRCRPGFNEAAADDRGKHMKSLESWDRNQASMRPRPMTAENLQRNDY